MRKEKYVKVLNKNNKVFCKLLVHVIEERNKNKQLKNIIENSLTLEELIINYNQYLNEHR